MPKCPTEIAFMIVVLVGAILVAQRCQAPQLVRSLPSSTTQGVK